MPTILALDQAVFLFINHISVAAPVERAAQFLSGIGAWGAIWLVIAVLLFFREEKRDRWFFTPVLLALGACFVVSEIVIKWMVARPRPTEFIGAIIRTYPGNYSFPSTHATIAWAMAYILSREEPEFRWAFYLLAILISLSRIYLGAHYPLDVLCGSLLGWGIGIAAVHIEKTFCAVKKPARKKKARG